MALRRDILSGTLKSIALLQWQPTLTYHDPDPPLTLLDPPPAPPSGTFVIQIQTDGVA